MSDEATSTKQEKKKRPSGPIQRVGVVIGAFGGADWLRDCIKSVLAQQLPARTKMEIVVACHTHSLAVFESAKEFEGDVSGFMPSNWLPTGQVLAHAVSELPPVDVVVFVDGADRVAPRHVASILAARKQGEHCVYLPVRETGPDSDPQAAPARGAAFDIKAYHRAGGHREMYAYAEEELLARAATRGVSIKELDGVPTYVAREHSSTPEEKIKEQFPRRFTHDRKVFACMKRGEEAAVEKRPELYVYKRF